MNKYNTFTIILTDIKTLTMNLKTLTMKKIVMYSFHIIALPLLLTLYSCERGNSDNLGNAKDRVAENVRLSEYSDSGIIVAWDRIKGATSYTVQLLDSKDSEKPVDDYIVVSEDYYKFDVSKATEDYYVRVRANLNTVTSDWVYIMDGQEPARVIPKYGIVAEDFKPLELYTNFPEGWETHEGDRKSAYAGMSDTFPSGEWLMPDMYSISVSSITNKVGKWAMLLKGGVAPYLEMNFDLPDGASQFSFYFGAATQNANDTKEIPIVVKVEYSQDSGDTWVQMGDELVVSSVSKQYFKEYKNLDIKGPIRFRIGKDNSKARLFIDKIEVFKN